MLDDVLAIPIATLNELAQRADEQEHVYKNPAFAAGMRIVIKAVEEELAALGERLIDPVEAERISSLSRRQLRRTLHNYGTHRKPLYKLREVRIEGSRRHEGAKGDALKQQVAEQKESVTPTPDRAERKVTHPAPTTPSAPSFLADSGSVPAQVTPRRHRSSAREAHITEMARRAAFRHRSQAKASA